MPSPRRLLAIAALVAAAAWGVERLVVTDREAIVSLLEGEADSVVRGDWDAVARTVAEDYAERGMDRAALVAWLRGLWQRGRAASLSVRVDETRVEGDRAAARVTLLPGLPWAGFRPAGRVDLARTPDGWRITSVEPDEAQFFGR